MNIQTYPYTSQNHKPFFFIRHSQVNNLLKNKDLGK